MQNSSPIRTVICTCPDDTFIGPNGDCKPKGKFMQLKQVNMIFSIREPFQDSLYASMKNNDKLKFYKYFQLPPDPPVYRIMSVQTLTNVWMEPVETHV